MNGSDVIHELNSQLSPTYSVLQALDAGGQGSVFLGKRNGEDVAVKLFFPEDDRRRIERELDFLAGHTHPNLVRVLGHSDVRIRSRDCAVVIYELIPGGDLRGPIAAAELPLAEVVIDAGAQLGSAVEYLWSHRIVHRDIKPGNVFVRSDSDYVLGDIGFARHLDLSTLTPIGAVVGTNGYKAPEQQAGRRNLTIHADIFSLGVTLYEFASHIHPFDRTQSKIGSESPLPLDSHRPDLPSGVANLIDKMLRSDPSLRPVEVSGRFEGATGGAGCST